MGIDVFKTLGLAILGLLYVVPVLGTAADAPHIGDGASIHVTVAGSGVANVGGSLGAGVNAKQMIGSFISGNVSGKLNLTTEIKNAGVANASLGIGGSSTATQGIGSVKLTGTVAGGVTDQVKLTGSSGAVNVGAAVGGTVKACQLIGTIGLNCN